MGGGCGQTGTCGIATFSLKEKSFLFMAREKKVEMFKGVSIGGHHDMVDLRDRAAKILW